MEFTADNLNELDQMMRRAIREIVTKIIHEIVDPRFDAIELRLAAIEEEMRDSKPVLHDHGIRLNRLEKVTA
jgi:hypothetical protein